MVSRLSNVYSQAEYSQAEYSQAKYSQAKYSQAKTGDGGFCSSVDLAAFSTVARSHTRR